MLLLVVLSASDILLLLFLVLLKLLGCLSKGFLVWDPFPLGYEVAHPIRQYVYLIILQIKLYISLTIKIVINLYTFEKFYFNIWF